MRAWRLDPSPDIRTVTLVVGRSCIMARRGVLERIEDFASLEESSSNVGGVIDGGVLRVTTLETTRLTFS
jgi:hypothetical protein